MSRVFDEANDDDDDDFAVGSEMLSLLAESDGEGFSSEELYVKSQLAGEKVEVSRALGGLRKRGAVTSTVNPDNVRVFIITDKGLDELNGKIETRQTTLSELAPELTKGRKASKGERNQEPTVTLVSAKRYSGLNCMLSSEGVFVLEVPGKKNSPGQRLELNDEQTKHLWLYLAKLFPNTVLLQPKDE